MHQPARARHDAQRALELFQKGAEPGALSGDVGRAALLLSRALTMEGRDAEANQFLTVAVRHLPALGTVHPDLRVAEQLAGSRLHATER